VRQIIGVSAELVVEGVQREQGGAPFHGRVIAILLDDDGQGGPPEASSIWLLVADDDRPAPVWVLQSDVSAQRLGR
jgi:hypothetical protein